MKKILLSLGFMVAFAALTSCSETSDCSCSAVSQKASPGTAAVYPVYDWGGSCSNITANDIPELQGGNYSVNCAEI